MNQIKDELLVRSANINDFGFIKSRWFNAVRDEARKHLPKEQGLMPITIETINQEIGSMIEKSYCLVAVDPADPTFIHGFTVFTIVGGVLLIHFAYTRKVFRRMGIQKYIISKIDNVDQSLPIAITFVNGKSHWIAKANQKYQLKPNLRGVS